MILGASNCAPDNRHVDDVLAADRTKSWRHRNLHQACGRCGRACQHHEYSGLANLFHTFLMGIAFEARDGADGGDINEAVTALMQIWDRHMAT